MKVPRYSCQILTNREFPRKIFENSTNIKFHENLSRASRDIPCAQTDGCGPGSIVGIESGYGLGGPGIEFRLGRDFPHLSGPALGPTQPPVQ